MKQSIKERVHALRMTFHSNSIKAFIIPSTDPHLSEYVAPHWMSREWISGFTGSAGTAVILMDKAGLWTDSRYFLQATKELEGSGITLYKALLFAMPLVYPLFSLLLGRTFPMITSPVMPCSVAVFTIGLMLAFSERVNIVLAMFLCHWALIGLSKVYFFGIPEDYLLACSIVPALYLFFREYIRDNAGRPTKPSPRVLNALLAVMCLIIGCFFAFTLLHQLNLFTDC